MLLFGSLAIFSLKWRVCSDHLQVFQANMFSAVNLPLAENHCPLAGVQFLATVPHRYNTKQVCWPTLIEMKETWRVNTYRDAHSIVCDHAGCPPHFCEVGFFSQLLHSSPYVWYLEAETWAFDDWNHAPLNRMALAQFRPKYSLGLYWKRFILFNLLTRYDC